MKQKGICEECKKEYEYEYNSKYPRKYCPECSAKKKAEFAAKQTPEDMQNPETFPVEKPGQPIETPKPIGKTNSQTAMYVSYAKDIFCALVEKGSSADHNTNMKVATNLVKQAMQELQ